MSEDGWGEARPEEYIDALEAPVAPGHPSSEWADANVEYVQAPQVPEFLTPSPSQVQMGGGSEKLMGTVKTWINEKGFGFIRKPDGSDVFVHHTAVYAQGKASLEVGESVEFNVIISEDGRSKAENVTGPGGVHVKGCSASFGGGVSSAGGRPCRNFQSSGECRFGTNCRFVHGNVGGSGGNASNSYGGASDGYGSPYSGGRGNGYSSVGGSRYGGGGGSGFGKPCFNFQNNGHCKFGERCRFAHE